MQHRMPEMHPCVCMRLGHPQEVSWYGLDGILFQGGQDAEELVSYRR